MKQSFVEKMGITYPIIQAPMAGGIVPASFVAEVSNFGMFGTIASGYLSLEQLASQIMQVKEKTDRPFGVNLFVDYATYVDIPLKKPKEIIAIEKSLGMAREVIYSVPKPPSMDDLVTLVIECDVKAVSTTFDLLKSSHVEALKRAGVILMTTVNSVYEMEIAVQEQDSDVLIYQNNSAGGHKGGFTPLPHSKEEAILAFLRNKPDVYGVIAGGIVDHKDIQTRLAKGFDAVQIGTGFLATKESTATTLYKETILDNQSSKFTTSITGKQARGIKNRIAGIKIEENPGFPFMHYATSALRKFAKENNLPDYQSLWCGASIDKIDKLKPLKKYMEGLVQ